MIGYVDDLIPCEPRAVASRSIVPVSPRYCIMIIGILEYMSCSAPDLEFLGTF